MIDLSTTYMGMKLKNPILVSSSGLTSTADKVEACARAGAGAVVLKSIFEEDIRAKTREEASHYNESMHPEAHDYVERMSFEHEVHDYLELIQKSKERVDIPVIASMNCSSAGEWTEFATWIEEAGADAIELNLMVFPQDIQSESTEIEKRYLQIFEEVKRRVKIPVSVKLGPLFTNIGNVVKKLSAINADGIVLFNRFQTLYIEEPQLNETKLEEGKWLSHPEEKGFVHHWILKLFGRVEADISATSGIRRGEDILEMILAGASAAQVASILYLQGIDYISILRDQLESGMKQMGFSSLVEAKGRESQVMNENVKTYHRLHYYQAISVLNQYMGRK
jgi:dihydroorotate dehydrogenase (fumarate)